MGSQPKEYEMATCLRIFGVLMVIAITLADPGPNASKGDFPQISELWPYSYAMRYPRSAYNSLDFIKKDGRKNSQRYDDDKKIRGSSRCSTCSMEYSNGGDGDYGNRVRGGYQRGRVCNIKSSHMDYVPSKLDVYMNGAERRYNMPCRVRTQRPPDTKYPQYWEEPIYGGSYQQWTASMPSKPPAYGGGTESPGADGYSGNSAYYSDYGDESEAYSPEMGDFHDYTDSYDEANGPNAAGDSYMSQGPPSTESYEGDKGAFLEETSGPTSDYDTNSQDDDENDAYEDSEHSKYSAGYESGNKEYSMCSQGYGEATEPSSSTKHTASSTSSAANSYGGLSPIYSKNYYENTDYEDSDDSESSTEIETEDAGNSLYSQGYGCTTGPSSAEDLEDEGGEANSYQIYSINNPSKESNAEYTPSGNYLNLFTISYPKIYKDENLNGYGSKDYTIYSKGHGVVKDSPQEDSDGKGSEDPLYSQDSESEDGSKPEGNGDGDDTSMPSEEPEPDYGEEGNNENEYSDGGAGEYQPVYTQHVKGDGYSEGGHSDDSKSEGHVSDDDNSNYSKIEEDQTNSFGDYSINEEKEGYDDSNYQEFVGGEESKEEGDVHSKGYSDENGVTAKGYSNGYGEKKLYQPMESHIVKAEKGYSEEGYSEDSKTDGNATDDGDSENSKGDEGEKEISEASSTPEETENYESTDSKDTEKGSSEGSKTEENDSKNNLHEDSNKKPSSEDTPATTSSEDNSDKYTDKGSETDDKTQSSEDNHEDDQATNTEAEPSAPEETISDTATDSTEKEDSSKENFVQSLHSTNEGVENKEISKLLKEMDVEDFAKACKYFEECKNSLSRSNAESELISSKDSDQDGKKSLPETNKAIQESGSMESPKESIPSEKEKQGSAGADKDSKKKEKELRSRARARANESPEDDSSEETTKRNGKTRTPKEALNLYNMLISHFARQKSHPQYSSHFHRGQSAYPTTYNGASYSKMHIPYIHLPSTLNHPSQYAQSLHKYPPTVNNQVYPYYLNNYAPYYPQSYPVTHNSQPGQYIWQNYLSSLHKHSPNAHKKLEQYSQHSDLEKSGKGTKYNSHSKINEFSNLGFHTHYSQPTQNAQSNLYGTQEGKYDQSTQANRYIFPHEYGQSIQPYAYSSHYGHPVQSNSYYKGPIGEIQSQNAYSSPSEIPVESYDQLYQNSEYVPVVPSHSLSPNHYVPPDNLEEQMQYSIPIPYSLPDDSTHNVHGSQPLHHSSNYGVDVLDQFHQPAQNSHNQQPQNHILPIIPSSPTSAHKPSPEVLQHSYHAKTEISTMYTQPTQHSSTTHTLKPSGYVHVKQSEYTVPLQSIAYAPKPSSYGSTEQAAHNTDNNYYIPPVPSPPSIHRLTSYLDPSSRPLIDAEPPKAARDQNAALAAHSEPEVSLLHRTPFSPPLDYK